MTAPEHMRLPAWVDGDAGRLCFILRLAALFHNDMGSLTQLSEAIGLSKTSLHMTCKRGQIAPEHAVAIEHLLGRPLFPRELFRPDLFTLPE